MANVGVVATVEQLINGYFFPSVALTANSTLTTPSAAVIIARLSVILKENKSQLAGTTFSFTIDNTQAGAFSRTLVGGAGVTIPIGGVAQNETAEFKLTVVSGVTPAINISRSDQGASSSGTLAETLALGNTTGGTDIEITHGDSITGSGRVFIESTSTNGDAIALEALFGGVSIISGIGGILAHTIIGGLFLLSGQATSDAIIIRAIHTAGGIDIDSGTGGVSVTTTGFTTISGTGTPPPNPGDPILSIESGTSGRGSHLRSKQPSPPTMSIDPIFPNFGPPSVGDPFTPTSTDMSGKVTFQNSASGSSWVKVIYNQPYATAPNVTITAANAPSSTLTNVFITSFPTSFNLNATAPSATPSTFSFFYHVVEN